LVTVSFSDPEGQLDLNTFKAILNGTDVTSSYMGGSTFPSPLPPGSTGALWPVNQSQSFGPGTNVLRVTIADVKGSVSGDTFARFTDGSFIDYITPRAATPGATVSIFGCGFSPTAALNIVKFGTTPATSVTPVGSYQLNVVVPPITNDVDVTVTVDGVTSNPRPFDLAFTAAPSASPTLVVAIDNQDNVYYTSNDNCIRKVTPTGGQSTFICIPEQITGMQFDSTRTILYVSSRGAPTADRQLVGSSDIYTFNSGYIRSVAPNGASSVIATFPATGQFTDVSGVALDRNNNLFVAAIQLVGDPASPSDVVLGASSGFSSPLLTFGYSSARLIQDLAIDVGQNIYVTYCSSQSICDVYANGAPVSGLSGFGGQLEDMTITCSGRLLVTDYTFGSVYVLDPDGAVRTAGNSFTGPEGIDEDRDGNIYVGDVSGVRRDVHYDPGGGVFRDTACANDIYVYMNGDNLDMISDHNAQSARLVAGFAPNIGDILWDAVYLPPGTGAVWQCFDPDDPATDRLVDPLVGATDDNDNNGTYDGSLVFTPVTGYPMSGASPSVCNGTGSIQTSIDTNGNSDVDLHGSNAPGDNFVATVSITIPRSTGNVVRSLVSETMTVWKAARVELDSMGSNVGPFDSNDDDALIGNNPDPDGTLLAQTFLQAYIDIQLVGAGTRTDVAFDPHVPNSYANQAIWQQEEDTQGALGRDFSSAQGDWRLYAQGAYEGPVEADNDVDPGVSEHSPWFGVTSLDLRYSLVMTETLRDVSECCTSTCSPPHAFDEAYMRRATTLHELGHQFGLADFPTCGGINGIMDSDAFKPYFIGAELRKIRTTSIPSN